MKGETTMGSVSRRRMIASLAGAAGLIQRPAPMIDDAARIARLIGIHEHEIAAELLTMLNGWR